MKYIKYVLIEQQVYCEMANSVQYQHWAQSIAYLEKKNSSVSI